MNLYVHASEFLEVKAALEEMDASPEVLRDTLESYQAPIEEKVEELLKYRQELLATSEMQAAEAKRIAEAAKKNKEKADNLMSYVEETLRSLDIKEMQAGIFKAKFRKGSKVTQVDESKLPEAYWVPQPPKPMSKTELKKLVEAGEAIEGVTIVQNPDSLTVKL